MRKGGSRSRGPQRPKAHGLAPVVSDTSELSEAAFELFWIKSLWARLNPGSRKAHRLPESARFVRSTPSGVKREKPAKSGWNACRANLQSAFLVHGSIHLP